MDDATEVTFPGTPFEGAHPEGIAILGSHPETVTLAPFDKPWLIYTCSPHNFEHRRLPRFDAWFELHDKIADRTRAYPYLKYLETLPLVWMRDKSALEHFPGAKLYPEEELRGVGGYTKGGAFQIIKLGKFSYFDFTSSIAYMMAKAIDDCEKLDIKQIGLWGIMQASKTEYFYQRPGIQYFIWECWRRGIKVVAPDKSALFQPPTEQW